MRPDAARCYCYRFATVLCTENMCFVLIQSTLRSRYFFCVMALRCRERTEGGQSPLYSRALAAKIATSWYLRLIPAGSGSGRGCVPANHGPQPASMRAAPAFRERLSDFEATNTGSFSQMVNKLKAGRTDRRPDKAKPPSGAKAAPYPRILPGGAALARAYRSSAMGGPVP